MAQDQQHSDKTPEEVSDRIWELMSDIDICMLMTWDGQRQDARPLSARPDREEHAIHFLVDVNGKKNAEIERFPEVGLTFSDKSNYKFVAISGTAKVTNDRAKIKALWNAADKAWWDNENDPDIRLLTVTPAQGELWDSPGKAVSTVKMMVAAVTGAKPDMGDNARVRL